MVCNVTVKSLERVAMLVWRAWTQCRVIVVNLETLGTLHFQCLKFVMLCNVTIESLERFALLVLMARR